MLVRKSESLEQYFELLQRDSQEAKALFDDLLIKVTDFFRDPDVFESAKRVASAVGEGAMAVMLVHRYLERT